MSFALSSPAFAAGARIPRRFTGDGEDRSPPLQWAGAPPETRGFALAVRDPDAPGGIFHHWLLFNIPPTLNRLPEAFPGDLPIGTMREAKNGFGHQGYGGPLPPHGHGPHRYVFTLYALPMAEIATDQGEDLAIEDLTLIDQRLEEAALGRAELIGLYER